jgi:hypothetical protein
MVLQVFIERAQFVSSNRTIAYLYFVGRQHLKYEYPDGVIWI